MSIDIEAAKVIFNTSSQVSDYTWSAVEQMIEQNEGAWKRDPQAEGAVSFFETDAAYGIVTVYTYSGQVDIDPAFTERLY